MSDDELSMQSATNSMLEEQTDDTADFFRAGSPDHVLQNMQQMANRTGFGFAITLQVDGFLVCGTMISGETFFSEVAELEAKAFRDAESAEAVRSYFNSFGTIYSQASGEAKLNSEGAEELPVYVHLRSAKMWTATGGPMPKEAVLWRGRISRVSGFFMGTLGH